MRDLNLHRKRLVLIHSSLGGAWRLAQGFHFSFAHGIISAIVVEDHGALVGALIGLVASAAQVKHLRELVLTVSSVGVEDHEALGLKFLAVLG